MRSTPGIAILSKPQTRQSLKLHCQRNHYFRGYGLRHDTGSSRGIEPSFELLRPAPDRPEEQLAVLVANLPPLEAALEAGAVAVIEPGRAPVSTN